MSEVTEVTATTLDPVMDRFSEMFKIQYGLNTKTYDTSWIEKGRSEEFDYLMAAGDEAHEFLRSLPYQWWTKDKTDRQNQVTEIVDAWHFVMSQFIIDKMTVSASMAVDRAAAEAHECYNRVSYYGGLAQTVKKQAKAFVASCYLHNTHSSMGREEYLTEFFRLCAIAGVSIDLLYSRYIAKATLNKFRVENGYKQGKYQKIWQLGEERGEDNYFLSTWVDKRIAEGQTPTAEEVTNYLTLTYPAVVHAMQPAA